MPISEYIAAQCRDFPWFSLEHETVILGRTVSDDDDPLLSDEYFARHAKQAQRNGYPELPKVQIPGWCTPDSDLPYPPHLVARIGQSGWNYIQQTVAHVCYEFDLASEHKTTGISAEELAEVREALSALPYVEVRLSTGGNGLHVRIRLTHPVPAPTRAEYQATLRHVFAYLCEQQPDLGLQQKIDPMALGRGNLWIWSNRMTADSFRLLSAATETLDIGGWQPAPAALAADFYSSITKPNVWSVIRALTELSPSRADNREHWMRVGMALHTLGDEFYPVFDAWSKQSENYGGTAELWNSLKRKPDGVGIGTLFHFAAEDTKPSQSKTQLPRFKISELNEKYPMPREQIIEGLLRRGDVANIVGGPKSRKSFMVALLAICVALGWPFLKWPTKRGRVLIIDNELRGDDLKYRLRTIATALDMDLAEIDPYITIIPLRGILADLATIRDDLLASGERFDLIILDALYKALPQGTEENSNSDMTRAYVILDQLAETLNCGTVVIHHTSRGSQANKAVTDMGAGAGAQSRSADVHIALRDHEDENTVTLEAVIRSQRPIEPCCMTFDYPIWKVAAEKDPTRLATATKKPMPTLDQFLALIPSDPAPKKDVLPDVKTRLGCTWDSINALVARAKSDGLIEIVEPTNKTLPHTICRKAGKRPLAA